VFLCDFSYSVLVEVAWGGGDVVCFIFYTPPPPEGRSILYLDQVTQYVHMYKFSTDGGSLE
jgi:hypothetical protein